MNYPPEDHQLYDMDQPPPPGPPMSGAPGPNAAAPGDPLPFNDGGNFGGPPFGGPNQGPMDGMAGGGPMSGKEQALMWQQGHYMGSGAGGGQGGESGFISGATTQPSSQSGHDDELLAGGGGGGDASGMGCYTGPGSIAGSSLYDLDSAHPSEVSSVHSSQAAFGLSDPEEFIPRLVNSLCDEDPVVVHESLILVERCVKKENFFNTLIRSLDLVGAIVQALINSTQQMAETANTLANCNASGANTAKGNQPKDPEQQRLQEQLDQAEKRAKSASNILRSMTNHRDPRDQRESDNQRVACQNILATGGIAPLTALLGYPLDRIKFNAIATIHSLLLCLDQDERSREAAKQAVREANGVQLMVDLLKRDNNKLLTILTDCLRILAMRNQQTKMVILQGHGPQLLVEIMKKQTYKNLILMTARLLKVLSVCPHNKQAIIQAGGMEALAKHLRSDQSKITYNCSWTMRNLSDVATGITDAGPLAVELVHLLRHNEEPVVICAAGILSNLTVNNERLKLAVCEANGIQELLRVTEILGRNHELLEPAICALRHLTNNHKAAETAQRLFLFELDGLPKIGRWLHPAAHRPSTKAVLGVVRNLAQRPANHQILREKHTVEQVFVALSAALDQLSQGGNQPVEGVRLEEIVEASLSCVFHMAKESSNRAVIRDLAVVRLMKRILSCGPPPQNGNGETIVRLAAGVVNEISSDIEGAFIIQREGVAEPVKGLMNSRNEKIASYATSILFNLTNLKNEIEKGNFHPPNVHQQQQQLQQNMQNNPPYDMFGGNPPPSAAQHNQPPHPQNQGMPHGNFQNQMGPNQGFDDMMGDPMSSGPNMQVMHPGGPPPPTHPGQMGNFHGGMGSGHGGPPGPPQNYPSDDISMEMGQIMSPPYNSASGGNFQGFFEGGSM